MLTKFINQLLQRESKVPEYYVRMIRSEYRSVPFDYVEHYLQTHKRLPTQEELQNAI
jgi:hypothetical protein